MKYERVNSLRKELKKQVRYKSENSAPTGEVFQKGDLTLVNEDASVYLKKLPSESFHLVLTSPPYNCNINYKGYNDNLPHDHYEEILKTVFQECFRLLVKGGRLVMVVPTVVVWNNKRTLYPVFIHNLIESLGFNFRDFIIWVKALSEKEAIGVAGRSTAWGSYRKASSPYTRPISEVIVVYEKEGKLQTNGELIDENVFKKATMNVWFIQQKKTTDHPASFPEDLAERVIRLYTEKGMHVLDPFAGTSSTLIAAFKTGRKATGIEISRYYFNESKRRLIDALNRGTALF